MDCLLPRQATDFPSEVVSVSCGEAHAVALCASGEVVTWGCGIHGEAAAEAVVYSVRPQLVPLLGVLRETGFSDEAHRQEPAAELGRG